MKFNSQTNCAAVPFHKSARKIACLFLGLVVALCAVFSVIFMTACGDSADNETVNEYPTYSKVGYSAKILGTVPRTKPEVSDGGLARYPVYGTTLAGADETERAAIIAENDTLVASSSTYDSMDSQGNLYLNGVAVGRKLYKHTAATGMYYGDVSDDEPALVKQISIQARPYGDHITGLYAPAGEVIKIEMSEEDLKATGGLVILIGQALQNGQANNIWLARTDLCRMPVILNTMTVSSTVGYVGSYLGGPIYVKPVNAGTDFTVTISGGVKYAHYIYGYTTEEDYEYNADTSAPYFDCEVWEKGVRFSGPISGANGYGYDDFYKSCTLWEKIASVSTQVPSASSNESIIGFIFDPFVAAGAAVAFPGRSSVNCPVGWMSGVLNYESFVENGGWGNIHEYNHNHQSFGFSDTTEVTNNAMTLVSYSLFTNISAHRTIDGGVSDWNVYTVPSTVLKKTIATAEGGTTNNALDAYANILYSFGADAFIQAAKNGGGNNGADVYFKALCDATGYDMTYYVTELLHQTVSADILEEYKAKNLPMYVPVASVFETGVSYLKGGKTYYTETVKPFEIDALNAFEINLNEQIVLPEGFTCKITKVTQPENGKINKTGDNIYEYVPTDKGGKSGKIYVTLKITKDDKAFDVKDVELVFEFSTKTSVLERSVYTYSSDKMYSSATEAYDANYAGYDTMVVENNDNPTQNSNSEIWAPDPSSNAVMEIRGKVYIPSDGKYRFAIRGRKYANLYISLDEGKNYSLAGAMENTTNTPNFLTDDEKTYSDYTLTEGQYVYFKAVLLVSQSNAFIGVGWGKFDGDKVTISYLDSAIRQDATYAPFTSEIAYPKNYTYSLPDDELNVKQTLVDSKYSPWDSSKDIANLFDEDETNSIHSDKVTPISEENPFEMTVELSEQITTNKMVIYGEPTRQYQPKTFKLYGGTNVNNLKLIADVEEATRTGNNVEVSFEKQNIKYYKLVVTDTFCTAENNYIAFRGVKFFYEYQSFSLLSPDVDNMSYDGGWDIIAAKSVFGHVYYSKNSTATLTFSGTGFAIFKSNDADFNEINVRVDGNTVKSADLSTYGDDTLAFMVNDLSDRAHTVEITASKGANISAIAIIPTDENAGGLSNTAKIIIILVCIVVGCALIVACVYILVTTLEKSRRCAADGESQTETKPVAETKTTPVAETKTKPVAETKTKPVAETKTTPTVVVDETPAEDKTTKKQTKTKTATKTDGKKQTAKKTEPKTAEKKSATDDKKTTPKTTAKKTSSKTGKSDK